VIKIGYHHSESVKRKIGEARKGKHHTKETIIKIRKSNLGQKRSDLTKKRISDAKKAQHLHWSDSHKKRISDSQIGLQAGDKHWNWKGGITRKKYEEKENRKGSVTSSRETRIIGKVVTNSEKEIEKENIDITKIYNTQSELKEVFEKLKNKKYFMMYHRKDGKWSLITEEILESGILNEDGNKILF